MMRIAWIRLIHLVLLSLLLSEQALAWTPGLKEAAEAFALGKASAAQEMMLFVHNKEVNLLAQEGKISMSTYRRCQEDFFRLNEEFATKAVREAGFDPSISNRKYNPGTDTDVNVLGKGGKKVRLEDIKKIDANYQKIVQEHFRSKGLDPPAGTMQTETDFMPHPEYTDPQEFQRIVDYVNQNGGTAYKDPRAASAQAKLGTSQPMSIDEASSFSAAMKDMAEMKIKKANALRAQAKSIRSSNPGQAEYLEAQARQFDYQAAKYHNRIHAANNHLRRQYGLPENPKNITGFDQSADIIELAGRNPFTGKDASVIHNLHQSALQASTDDMIDTLVEVAQKDPSKISKLQKALGKEIAHLPPNRAGQAIERIENATKGVKGLEGTLARGAVAEARALKRIQQIKSSGTIWKKDIGPALGKGMKVIMTAGNAVLIASQGVSITLDNVKATDTLWDYFRNCYYHAFWEGTGIGPAFEQAQREEIDRFTKEVEAGRSPSMTKHVTFTLLKTGVYMGKDAIIGLLYLPDTIWEYFTQEKELEGYAAMQNELAKVMRQMILDRKNFEQTLANMKKMGLADADAKPFLDCLCSGCGGSLGGFFNPGFESDVGHGPCQCNGPLSIWKTPLPTDKQAQYECFNKVTTLRYDQAQAVFEKWRQRVAEENAKSVQPEFHAIMQDVTHGVMKEEEGARNIADRFASIRDLLLPQDVDSVRALVEPHLQNHAVRNLETGDVDRAVDNLDRALNKIGARSAQQRVNLEQFKARYEQWAKKWRETKEQKFPEIEALMQKNQMLRARSEIETLEYRMLKDPKRPLPPAVRDPAFLRLKERLASLQKRYEQRMQEMWDKVKALGADHEHRLAIPILQKALEEWEHPPSAKDRLLRQLEYHQGEVKRAEDKRTLGRRYEKDGGLEQAILQYEESLRIQKDSALERDVARLKTTVQKQAQAKALWTEAQQLQGVQKYAEAIRKYKEGLALWDAPAIRDRVAGLEKFLADREKQKAAEAPSPKAKGVATQQNQTIRPAPASPPVRVAGKWRSTEGELTLTQKERAVSGSYPKDRGEIVAEMTGNVLEGYWIEDAANKRCATAKKGRFYWGRIKWIFSGDRFSGGWGYCEEAPVHPWTGERLGAASDTGKSGGDRNASSPPTTSPKAKTAQPQPAPTTASAPEVSVPKGWKPVAIGNVRFAVPASWQYTTEPDPESGKIHIYWDGNFDAPKHGVSGGVVGSYGRAKSEFSGLRTVHLGGVDVLRADDGSAVNFLFPPMPDGRAVLLIVVRGPAGRQEVIDAVLSSVRVDGQAGSAAGRTAPPERTFEVGNTSSVDNGPTQPTVFSLKSPRVLAAISTYHWNHGKGTATPGTIALRDFSGRLFGPWKTQGSPGQGGVPNANWTARPMAELPAGTYTVVDSDPATWAHNPQSGGRGFVRVETLPVGDSAGTAPKGRAMERWVNARDPNHYVQRETTAQGVRWVEYINGKALFRFEEKGRSSSERTVTLDDPSRGISATLYPDRFDYGRGSRILGTHRGGWE